jgi:hypothetical protein
MAIVTFGTTPTRSYIPDFVLPADGSSTVSCPADATAPTPPSVTDACGNAITPVAGPAPSPTACEGAMVYTFTYTDCRR